MEDESMIELYWQRDESAIAETEKKYGQYCRAVAGNILRIAEDVEECVADTWLSAWNSMPPQRPAKLPLFLGRITRNGALDRVRQQTRQKRGGGAEPLPLDELSECVPAPEGIERELEDREIAAVISRWLRTLPRDKRSVFVRRYWYFEDVRDIAARFGFTAAKTTSMLHRMREELKKTLESEGIAL